jgi:hypothetical protein
VAPVVLAYGDDAILLGDNIDTIKKNTETLIHDIKEVEKTKYMLLFRHQNAGKNPDIKIANRPFEKVSQLKFWERQ